MARFGVLAVPRIIRVSPPIPPLEARANQSLSLVKGVSCPLAQASGFWESYLGQVRGRPVHSKQGRKYTLKELSWIEGLEWDQSRAAVVELVLRHPEVFEPVVETAVERSEGGGDSSPVPSITSSSTGVS